MIRTQIYLSKALKDKLVIIAKENNITVSKVIRNLLENSLETMTNHNLVNEKNNTYEPEIRSLAHVFSEMRKKNNHIKSPKDLAKNLDYYLYVEPYEKKDNAKKRKTTH